MIEHDGCVGCLYDEESADSWNCINCKQNSIDRYVKPRRINILQSMKPMDFAEFLINFKNTFGEEYEGIVSCADWLLEYEDEEENIDDIN